MPISERWHNTQSGVSVQQRHDQSDHYFADQLSIDLPAGEELVASFTSGYSPMDPTRPDTGSTDSTYRLRINVEPGAGADGVLTKSLAKYSAPAA